MHIRLFIIDAAGGLRDRASRNYASAQEYMQDNSHVFPSREYIAWEDGDRGAPVNLEERVQRCAQALVEMRRFDGGAAMFERWCRNRGLNNAPVQTICDASPAAPLIKGKPRTVIVQDFIRDTGASEVARRAWDATVAACKGA